MGVSSPDAATHSVRCRGPDCESFGPRNDYIDEDYCSWDCKHRADGWEHLRSLVHDHRYCGYCFTQLKQVEYAERIQSRKPRVDFRRAPEAFIGYQYRLPPADHGEKERSDPPNPLVGTGTVCGECGTTATNDPMPWGELSDIEAIAERFCDAFERENDDAEVDRERLIETARDRGLAYAAGKHVTEA